MGRQGLGRGIAHAHPRVAQPNRGCGANRPISANRRRSRASAAAWSRASPSAPRGSGVGRPERSVRLCPRLAPCQALPCHDLGGASRGRTGSQGSPVRGARSAGRRPDLDGPSARATIAPGRGRGASNGGRGPTASVREPRRALPGRLGRPAHRTRCSSPPSGADGGTRPKSTPPLALSAMRPTANRPGVDPGDVAELLEEGIRQSHRVLGLPRRHPRRTDAVICGRTCLQGFRSEGGEDVRSCPRTPRKMSRDAVDLFGLVGHGARDGLDGPPIQDVRCSLSGPAG